MRYMQRWEEIVYARQDGVTEGIEQGLEQGIQAFLSVCRDFGTSQEGAFDKLKEKFRLEDEKAMEYMTKFWT